MRAAFIGGVYSNWLALEAALSDARRRGAEQVYCLGDLGAFGPHPDRSIEILRAAGIRTVQGNYDESIGNDRADCGCGYTDPRDNHYARLSYSYTHEKTSSLHKPWLRDLPRELSLDLDGRRALLVHGSPRQQNEFLWDTSSPDHLLERMCGAADLLLCTHTGLHWQRRLPSGKRVINVGALGRPANDGRTCVWYALLDGDACEFIPVEYDHARLAREMEAEKLPPEFIETIVTGWWTTCLEILPAKERLRGRY